MDVTNYIEEKAKNVNELVKISSLDTPTKVNEVEAKHILRKIKNIPLYGREYRGRPVSLETKNLFKYTNKQGRTIYEGPEELELESHRDYLDELFEANGTLSKDRIGKIYWLSTTMPNSSMSDPVTGVSTKFQYRAYNDGLEDLFFDSVKYGGTHTFWDSDISKISNSGLKKIVEAINPNSKLI